MKVVKIILKRIIYASFLLYGYNLISVNFNMMIPMNLYNLSFISLFGSFGLIGLVLFKYMM